MREGIKNLWQWFKVVWKYRWWDYEYDLDIMYKSLEIKSMSWLDKTHYVGARFTYGRMQVVMKYYKMYKDTNTLGNEDEYRSKFIQGYARLLPRLWD